MNRLAIFLLVVATLAAGPLRAQEDEGGAVAMGSQGRMVRGTVTAAMPDHLTVKTDAGDVFQIVVTRNTRMMKDRQPIKFADIHPGDGLGAMGVIDQPTKTVHAAAVFVVDAAQIKKLKDDMGKTYISGKVMAIDELELTIHRQDGVTQKIAVDEGTSFKKGGRRAGAAMRGDGTADSAFGGPERGAGNGGESITLADVKVGDMVIGPGTLKAGMFVPTQLTVIDAASMERRHRPNGENGPGAGPSTAQPGPH